MNRQMQRKMIALFNSGIKKKCENKKQQNLHKISISRVNKQ